MCWAVRLAAAPMSAFKVWTLKAGAGRLLSSLGRELMCDGGCPTAVAQRMHFYPDPVLPCAQLQRARTAWNPKVPMMAAGAPSQLTLASNHEAAPAALLQALVGGELEIEFEHGWLSS